VKTRIFVLPCTLLLAGCATTWHLDSVEAKVDRLLANTQRETLAEIFGQQSQEIASKMDELDARERERLDELLGEYQKGASSIEEVRTNLLSVLGGTTRVVSSRRGIWVRDLDGEKRVAIARDTKIAEARRLEPAQLPPSIADNRALARFTWGEGEVDGETVLFPWELTMSTFTKEIVENTARRTAQEFLRMSEGRGWKRPVYIKVITETPEDEVKVSPPGVEEVYVVPGDGEGAE
jgi:outer membrane murein-binding lipoprotein Lpp